MLLACTNVHMFELNNSAYCVSIEHMHFWNFPLDITAVSIHQRMQNVETKGYTKAEIQVCVCCECMCGVIYV